MSQNEEEIGWCLIPPWVMADRQLTMTEKVVCGRVWGLASTRGYCFASNQWLSARLGIAESTLTHCLTALARRGHIRVELIRDEKKAIVQRRIYPLTNTAKVADHPLSPNPAIPLPSEVPDHPLSPNPAIPLLPPIAENGATLSPNSADRGVEKEGRDLDSKSTHSVGSRKNFRVPRDVMTRLVETYKQLKGIKVNGSEHLPIQQAMKSMLMDGNTPEQIISLMEAFAASSAEWTKNWTYRTVRLKLPEWRAGKLVLSDNGARGRGPPNALRSGVDYGAILERIANGEEAE